MTRHDPARPPRSHGDGREGVGRGIAYLTPAEAALRVGVHRDIVAIMDRLTAA